MAGVSVSRFSGIHSEPLAEMEPKVAIPMEGARFEGEGEFGLCRPIWFPLPPISRVLPPLQHGRSSAVPNTD